jgi:hypothetical protein
MIPAAMRAAMEGAAPVPSPLRATFVPRTPILPFSTSAFLLVLIVPAQANVAPARQSRFFPKSCHR